MEYFFKINTDDGNRLIPLDYIAEVAPMLEFEEINAQTHPDFVGVMFYRGNHIPVYDIEKIADDPEIILECLILIVKDENGALFGLRTRDDCEIISAAPGQIDQIDTGTGKPKKVVQLDAGMVEVWLPTTPNGAKELIIPETASD